MCSFFFYVYWSVDPFSSTSCKHFDVCRHLVSCDAISFNFLCSGCFLEPTKSNKNLEHILTRFYTRKFSKQDFSLQVFALDVEGDDKLGQIKVTVKNQLSDCVVFSQTFGLQEEAKAMETIAEAQYLVQDANLKIKHVAVEAKGFVNRAVAQSTR